MKTVSPIVSALKALSGAALEQAARAEKALKIQEGEDARLGKLLSAATRAWGFLREYRSRVIEGKITGELLEADY